MKKTITINLGGIVFYIDEDAYGLLHRYLENIRLFFKKKGEDKEIVADIESRMAELLSENITHPNQPITQSDVEAVINQIGQPEDFYDEEADSNTSNKQENQSESKREGFEEAYKYKKNKKFFRNPDDKIFGGVASGLAAYFGVDVVIVRVILLALLFAAGTSFWIYLFLWIFIPEAKTAIEKLQMYGKDITVENIGKQVNYETEYETEPNRSNRPIDNMFRGLGCFMKGIIFIVLIALTPVWVVLFVVLFGLVLAAIAGTSALVAVFGEPFTNIVIQTPTPTLYTLFLVIGIPIGVAIYALLRLAINKLPPISNPVKWILVILWFILLIVLMSTNQSPVLDLWRVSSIV